MSLASLSNQLWPGWLAWVPGLPGLWQTSGAYKGGKVGRARLFFGTLLALFFSGLFFKGLAMAEEVITGVREAAEFLGCGEVTVHRMIKRGEFPQPFREFGMNTKATKKIRVWKKADLESFRPNMRGRGNPNLIKK